MTTLQAVMTSIRTISGRLVNPLDLKPEDINIDDIAHALANQTRFAGHTKRFYSLAEHSVNVCKHVSEQYALEALLHDGSEAYLVDLPSPIKHAPGFEIYGYYEDLAQSVIERVFGISPTRESHAIIKIADRRMLATEMRDLTNRDLNAPYPVEPYSNSSIVGMGPNTAKKYFLAHFNNLQLKS